MSGARDPRLLVQRAHEIFAGRIAPSAPDEAIRLVQEACAQNLPFAQLYHAALAARGHGRPQSFEDALSYVRQAAAAGDASARGQLTALGGGIDPAAWLALPPMTQHHTAPRVFVLEKFLPPAICAWLIERSREALARARSYQTAQGGAVGVDDGRSNSVAGSNTLEPDLVLQLVNLRIAAAIDRPLAHQEATNVLHYARGQAFAPHYDFVTPADEALPAYAAELKALGQRVVTVLVYLNDDYEGGETDFPRLNWRYRGKTGDALIFWNLSEAGVREPDSYHAGLPPTAGEKWLLSKWVRERPVPII